MGRRHGSDPVLLWLWHRLAAIAPIGPLAWEPPYAMGEALKRKKKLCIYIKMRQVTHSRSHSWELAGLVQN